MSSSAFFIAAGVGLSDSDITVRSVGLNRTRTAFLDVLQSLGANIVSSNVRKRHGESVGDLHAASCELRASPAIILSGEIIANIIDEVPILAVLATQVRGRIELRDARELRVKESDRIRTVVEGIRRWERVEEVEAGSR